MIKHPAKFSEPLLPVMARYVDGARGILDPFAGTGRVGLLRKHLGVIPLIHANEIEPEWAGMAGANGCDFVRIGDARGLDCKPETFDAIVTSPTYGNRMADSCDGWAADRKHSTYHSALGRRPAAESSAALQWGDAYRELHRAAWAECWRVLKPGGRLVLNVADHYRDGALQQVPEWHVSALLALGFELRDWTTVGTQRYGFGANADKRAPELVILFEKPAEEYGSPFFFQPVAGGSGGLWDVRPEPQQLGIFA